MSFWISAIVVGTVSGLLIRAAVKMIVRRRARSAPHVTGQAGEFTVYSYKGAVYYGKIDAFLGYPVDLYDADGNEAPAGAWCAITASRREARKQEKTSAVRAALRGAGVPPKSGE